MADREKPQTGQSTSSPAPNRPWTIAEMAREFNVSHRTLRYYQQKGLLSPKRRGNTRLYSNRDYAHMKIIVAARDIDMSLDDISKILSAYHQTDGEQAQNKVAISLLQDHVEYLAKQQESLTRQLATARIILSERTHDRD